MNSGKRWNDADLLGRVETMEDRLLRGDSRMGAIEDELRENTAATSEVLEIVRMGKGFFRGLGHIGTAIKWVSTTALALGAMWTAWTQHKG